MDRFTRLVFLILLLNFYNYFAIGDGIGANRVDVQDCVPPSISPKGKLFLCGTNKVTLYASQGFSEYRWHHDGMLIEGANSESLTVNSPGLYEITAIDANGCEMISAPTEVLEAQNEDSIPLENFISTNGIKTEKGFRFCPGESIQLTVLGNFFGYVWTGGEDNLTSTVTITEPGTYEIAARVTPECALTQTIIVTTFMAPLVEVEVADTIFRTGESISFFATGAESYSWFPAEGLSNPNIANPTASPSKTTTYQVTGMGANGCSATEIITLYLDSNEINLNPPKVFSANRQMFWEIENIDAYPNLELVIFNRQGLEVFKAKPYLNNWNATFRGSPLPKGDYYFVMRGQGKQNLKTGSILVLR